MSLHHRSIAIYIHNQSRQVVTLPVYQPESIIINMNQTGSHAQLIGSIYLFKPELISNNNISKR
ncbi:hypothetical protein SDC9_35380 [bioreactor metagenome]|uniref:Uncharacterized protein n=1 Tax=bioreactor metagenome TaxID=1076179 RepID=A0A644VDC6_9ZZZZ